MQNDLSTAEIVLVGEIHGFESPCLFDYDFFKHLNLNYGISSYFCEFDFVQAHFLNEYLTKGNEENLNAALKNWAVEQGKISKDYVDKFRNLRKHYVEGKPFKFVGVDKIRDFELLRSYLNILANDSTQKQNDGIEKETIEKLLATITELKGQLSSGSDTFKNLLHIEKNIEYVHAKIGREDVLFQNFYDLFKANGREKAYGFFGLYHVFQYRVNGHKPMACLLRESDLDLNEKLVSVNFIMNDSYCIATSASLPSFMRGEGKYSKMSISADNLLFMYLYGIKDLIKTTAENEQTLIRFTGENNPYAESKRLQRSFQLLPVVNLFELNDIGKPYVQYSVFVRNSDWAEPLE